MAGSLNKVMLIGVLGADPEIRSFQNGGRVANMRLATSETWRDKTTGEKREKTEWHTVSVLNDNLVNVVEQYAKKGSKLYIEGQIHTRKYQAKDGTDRYATEIVVQGFSGSITLLDGPKGERQPAAKSGALPSVHAGDHPAKGIAQQRTDARADFDDEIPF